MENIKTLFNGKFHDAVSLHGPHVKFNSKLGGQRVEIHTTKGVVVGGIFRYAWKIYEHLNQVIPAMTFLVPKRWRSPTTFEFGLRLHHPKNRSQSQNCQVVVDGCWWYLYYCESRWRNATPKKWRLRNHDKPIHGSCAIYFPGAIFTRIWWFMIGRKNNRYHHNVSFYIPQRFAFHPK